MGEVYRARDPRLGRDVAIKVLASQWGDNTDRLSRFEQEARAAAALNHPNILAVYDVGRTDGSSYIVSEFLEGETLRERLRSGPLPVRKAVEYGVQMAHGLAAAHEKGIVHRDLKPDNIFLGATGRVTILDFGLAKLTEPSPSANVGSVVPTITPGTQPGMVLGTLGYMSPEQVRGIPADYRSDIFSFGAILYEMLLGRPAFQRETAADTMSAILKEHPTELTDKGHHFPPAIVRIVERCLEKSPAMRFQSTEDLAFALAGALSGDSDIRPAAVDAANAQTRLSGGWIAAAVASVIAAAALVAAVRGTPSPGTETDLTIKLTVAAPAGVQQIDPTMRVSPDGTKLVLAGVSSDGVRRLWLRTLNSTELVPVNDTEGAQNPFWSPDGRSLGFFSGGQLKRVSIVDAMSATLCSAPQQAGGSWSPTGTIVFSSEGQLHQIPAAGGMAAVLEGENGTRDGATLAYPTFLPDGRHFLYLDTGRGGVGEPAVYAGRIDGSDRTLVLRAAESNAWFGAGYLFYLRDTTLVAQPFDPERLTLSGNPVPVAEPVQRTAFGAPSGAFTVSDRALAYRTGVGARGFPTQLTWFDSKGQVLRTMGERGDYSDIEISPDGTRAVVSQLDPGTGRDLWIFDLARGIPTRFTTDPADEYPGVWSPDSSQVIFGSRRKGHFDLFMKTSSAAGNAQDLLVDDRDKFPLSWSPDGKLLLFTTGYLSVVGNHGHIWQLPLAGDQKPTAVLDDPQFTQYPGKLSPDGKWLAYVSTESGNQEVYVTAFPSLMGKWRISTAGGSWPRWSRDNKQLFFLDGTKLMAVDVKVSGAAQLSIGSVHELFEGRWPPGRRYTYDVAPNGNILAVTLVEQPLASPITIVVNWLAELRK